ncbi:hypothetical protein EVAR_17637_1 [Eumeta japonica]|uniref:Uncharacterized protein n=1 Tax=Eumeta variegata TaxID=151549 RepID=A0A4C1URJ6_EUMVA|nr:hypothetical protein EVAR_17637_1 [Eumeta japonica]
MSSYRNRPAVGGRRPPARDAASCYVARCSIRLIIEKPDLRGTSGSASRHDKIIQELPLACAGFAKSIAAHAHLQIDQ